MQMFQFCMVLPLLSPSVMKATPESGGSLDGRTILITVEA
jgi:hypothetical protein